jgi:hypothetical protein
MHKRRGRDLFDSQHVITHVVIVVRSMSLVVVSRTDSSATDAGASGILVECAVRRVAGVSSLRNDGPAGDRSHATAPSAVSLSLE